MWERSHIHPNIKSFFLDNTYFGFHFQAIVLGVGLDWMSVAVHYYLWSNYSSFLFFTRRQDCKLLICTFSRLSILCFFCRHGSKMRDIHFGWLPNFISFSWEFHGNIWQMNILLILVKHRWFVWSYFNYLGLYHAKLSGGN